MKFHILLFIFLLAMLTGCKHSHDHDHNHDHDHDAPDVEETNSNSIVFTEEQRKKVEFAVEEVRLEPFGQVIRATAQILPAQGDEQVIVAKTNGIVQFPNDNVVDGKAVGAGQTLFFIESAGLADNNLNVRYAEAESEYQRAKSEWERKQTLAKDQLVSESDRLQAQADFAKAEAVYNNLRKNFSTGRQAVVSPLSGFITQIPVRNGEYVEAGQVLLSVSQNRNLLIRAEIQPKYYSLLSGITSANFRFMNSDSVVSLQALSGKVLSFGKSVDAGSPLIPVVFQVQNKGNLLPGSFVETYIQTLTRQQALTIPNTAITEEMGNYFVFVQLSAETFEKRLIEKGATDGFRTEIVSGLLAGEQIVSRGAIWVKLTQASGKLDAHAGHAH